MSQEGDNRVIEIEGILRGGSDLDCVDGACNEVIGLEHENGYMRPYVPKDLGITLTGFTRLYVHKTQTQTNYLLIDTANSLWWISEAEAEAHKEDEGWINDNKRRIGLSVKSRDVQMVALGNLVAIDCLDVILFSEGKYTITVRGGSVDFLAKVGLKKNGFLTCQSGNQSRNNDKYVQRARMSAVAQSKVLAMSKGAVVGMCYMRYGLKLYDGSYVSMSTPVLVSDADYSEVRRRYTELNTLERNGGRPDYFDDWIESVRFRYQQRGYKASEDVLGMRWGLATGDADGATENTKAQYGLRNGKNDLVNPFSSGFYEQKIQFRTSRGELNRRDYPSLGSNVDACVVEDMDDGGIGWDSIWKSFDYKQPVRGSSSDLWSRDVKTETLSDGTYPLPVYAASTASAHRDGMYNSFAMRLMNCPFVKIQKAISPDLENYVVALDIMITNPVDYIKTPTGDEGDKYDNYYFRLPELKDIEDVKDELRMSMDAFYVLESIPFSQLKNMRENKSGSVYSIGLKNIDISAIASSERVPFVPSNSGLATRYSVSYLYNNRLHIAGISNEFKSAAYGGLAETGVNYLNNYLHKIYNTYSQYDTPTLGSNTESDDSKKNPYRFMEIRSDNEVGNGSKEDGGIYWDNANCRNDIGGMTGVVTTGVPFTLGESFDESILTQYKKSGESLYRWIKNGRIEQDLLHESQSFMIQDGRIGGSQEFINQDNVGRDWGNVHTTAALTRHTFMSPECASARGGNRVMTNLMKSRFGLGDVLVNEEMLAIVRFDINEAEGTSAARNVKSQYDVLSLSLFSDNLFRSYISPIAGLEKVTIESVCMMSLSEVTDGAMTIGYRIGHVRKIDVGREFTMIPTGNASSNVVYYINEDFAYVTLSGLTEGKQSEETTLSEFLSPVFGSLDSLSVAGNTFEVSEVNSLTSFDEINTYTAGRGTIIGFASNANDVSTGQFGQFPLYVFTTEGVFAFNIDTSGKVAYGGSVPVSRDVCNNRNSICETSKIVLFSSDRGLMLLHGSEVECISVTINGKPDKFLPHETAEERGVGLNVYSRAINDPRLVEGEEYLSSGAYGDFKDFISNNETHLAYMYEKDKVVAYNEHFEYVYLIDVVDNSSCYVTKIPSQLISHTDNYPDTMVLLKQDPVTVSAGTATGWIEYDSPRIEVESVTYDNTTSESVEFGKTTTDEDEPGEEYTGSKSVSAVKEIECVTEGMADIVARSGQQYRFGISLKITSKPIMSPMYYGEDSVEWTEGAGIVDYDKEAEVEVTEGVSEILTISVTRTPLDGGEAETVFHAEEEMDEVHVSRERMESWRWKGEEITLSDDAPTVPIAPDKRYSVYNIINNCQEEEGKIILEPIDYALHPDYQDAKVRISVVGGGVTVEYDQTQVNPQETLVEEGEYIVFADEDAGGEWEVVERGYEEERETVNIERQYSFPFEIDRDYLYRIEIGGVEYAMQSSYDREPAHSAETGEVASSLFGSRLSVQVNYHMDYEADREIYGEYGEVEMFEEVEPIALSQFTYDGEDVAQKVVLQTRPIKMTNALMKQAFRVVVRGDFVISDETPEGFEGHKRLGLYIMASNDTKKWMYIGGTEHEYNGYPMTDIGTTVERFTYKYLMIVLSGELARESYIKSIELSSQYKYNKKLR